MPETRADQMKRVFLRLVCRLSESLVDANIHFGPMGSMIGYIEHVPAPALAVSIASELGKHRLDESSPSSEHVGHTLTMVNERAKLGLAEDVIRMFINHLAANNQLLDELYRLVKLLHRLCKV